MIALVPEMIALLAEVTLYVPEVASECTGTTGTACLSLVSSLYNLQCFAKGAGMSEVYSTISYSE